MNKKFTVRQSIFSIPRYIMFNQGWNFDGIFNETIPKIRILKPLVSSAECLFYIFNHSFTFLLNFFRGIWNGFLDLLHHAFTLILCSSRRIVYGLLGAVGKMLSVFFSLLSTFTTGLSDISSSYTVTIAVKNLLNKTKCKHGKQIREKFQKCTFFCFVAGGRQLIADIFHCFSRSLEYFSKL